MAMNRKKLYGSQRVMPSLMKRLSGLIRDWLVNPDEIIAICKIGQPQPD